ncbi:MAG: SCO family protein [Pseudomonadota bacterium]
MSIESGWFRAAVLLLAAAATVAVTLAFAVLHELDPDPRPRLTLIDQHGQPFTEGRFENTWSLVFFGFTRCPHICPTELAKLSAALRELERTGRETAIQPVFVTVDPATDDAAVMRRYLAHFHPRIVGLTGRPDAVEAAAAAFGVLSGGDSGAGRMAHSTLLYVVDPGGRIVDELPREMSAADVARRIRELTS